MFENWRSIGIASHTRTRTVTLFVSPKSDIKMSACDITNRVTVLLKVYFGNTYAPPIFKHPLCKQEVYNFYKDQIWVL